MAIVAAVEEDFGCDNPYLRNRKSMQKFFLEVFL